MVFAWLRTLCAGGSCRAMGCPPLPPLPPSISQGSLQNGMPGAHRGNGLAMPLGSAHINHPHPPYDVRPLPSKICPKLKNFGDIGQLGFFQLPASFTSVDSVSPLLENRNQINKQSNFVVDWCTAMTDSTDFVTFVKTNTLMLFFCSFVWYNDQTNKILVFWNLYNLLESSIICKQYIVEYIVHNIL